MEHVTTRAGGSERARASGARVEQRIRVELLAGEALTCCRREDWSRAEELLRDAFAQDPEHAVVCGNLANVLNLTGRDGEALTFYMRAIELAPGEGDFRYNYANLLGKQGDWAEAVRQNRIASELSPDRPEVWNNLGLAHAELGEPEAALAAFDSGLELAPNNADLHFNRAELRIACGECGAAWDEYEWRMRRLPYRATLVDRPTWNGEDIRHASILVCGEQGVGDELLFAGCMPELIAQARHVVWECDPRLMELFRRSFPDASIIPTPDNDHFFETTRLSGTDYVTSLGSLPRFYRWDASGFPKHNGYLAANPRSMRTWKSRLAELSDGPVIGIAWEGGGELLVRQRKSIPLAAWEPVFHIPGATFVSLQYEANEEQLRAAESRFGIRIHRFDAFDPWDDLDELAGLIGTLDLVVSCSQVAAHFAGSLGRPVIVAVPRNAGWRWGNSGNTSLWYPSARLVRQSRVGDWDAPMQCVAEEIRRRIRQEDRP